MAISCTYVSWKKWVEFSSPLSFISSQTLDLIEKFSNIKVWRRCSCGFQESFILHVSPFSCHCGLTNCTKSIVIALLMFLWFHWVRYYISVFLLTSNWMMPTMLIYFASICYKCRIMYSFLQVLCRNFIVHRELTQIWSLHYTTLHTQNVNLRVP